MSRTLTPYQSRVILMALKKRDPSVIHKFLAEWFSSESFNGFGPPSLAGGWMLPRLNGDELLLFFEEAVRAGVMREVPLPVGVLDSDQLPCGCRSNQVCSRCEDPLLAADVAAARENARNEDS